MPDGGQSGTIFFSGRSKRFPAGVFESDPIFVAGRPVFTSAGVTAGIDR